MKQIITIILLVLLASCKKTDSGVSVTPPVTPTTPVLFQIDSLNTVGMWFNYDSISKNYNWIKIVPRYKDYACEWRRFDDSSKVIRITYCKLLVDSAYFLHERNDEIWNSSNRSYGRSSLVITKDRAGTTHLSCYNENWVQFSNGNRINYKIDSFKFTKL